MPQFSEKELENVLHDLGGSVIHTHEDPGTGVIVSSAESHNLYVEICAGEERSGIPPQLIIRQGNKAVVYTLEYDEDLTNIEQDGLAYTGLTTADKV